MNQSACGCVWERNVDYGDVVIVQCVRPAAESKTWKARKAYAAANEAVRWMRKGD